MPVHFPDFIIGPGSPPEEIQRYLSEIYQVCGDCEDRIVGPCIMPIGGTEFICNSCNVSRETTVEWDNGCS